MSNVIKVNFKQGKKNDKLRDNFRHTAYIIGITTLLCVVGVAYLTLCIWMIVDAIK